jgi:2'-5' RNA ligase
MVVDIKFSREEEKRLLKDWYETVQFDRESPGIPPVIDNDDEEDDDERKSVERAIEFIESKVIRRVRTPAGQRRYRQPIGSIIVRDGLLRNLELAEPQYEGWESVRDRNTGTEYSIGQDDDGNWIATTGDSWDPVVSADNEQDLYLILDDRLTPEGQELPSMARQRSEQLRPSNNVRASISEDLGGNANTITDRHANTPENNELIGILHDYGGADIDSGQVYAGANEYETRAALRRWLANNPDADPEVRSLASESVRSLTLNAKLKNQSVEQDEARSAEISGREQATANTPRRVKLGEVQGGMWIRLPDRDPNAWYRVDRVGVHSSARRSFDATDQNGKRVQVRQVTNREQIETAANPPAQGSSSTSRGSGRSTREAADDAVRNAQQSQAEEVDESEAFLAERRRAREERLRAAMGPDSVTGADGNEIRPGDRVYLGQPHGGGYGRSTWRVERTWPDGSVSISSENARTGGGVRGQVRNVQPDKIRLVNQPDRSQEPIAAGGASPREAGENLAQQLSSQDTSHPNLRSLDSDYEGWELYRGSNGAEYYVGEQDGWWYVTDRAGRQLGWSEDREEVMAHTNILAARERTFVRNATPEQIMESTAAARAGTVSQPVQETAAQRITGALEGMRGAITALRGNDVDAARAALEPLNATQLRQVASQLGVSVGNRDSVSKMRNALLYWTVQRRLDSEAVSRPTTTRAYRQEDLELKGRISLMLEHKAIRRVRTASGERRYGQPIGSIIVRDGAAPLANLRVGATNRSVEGTNGETYNIRRRSDGQWEAAPASGGGQPVTAGSQEQLLEDLDTQVGAAGGGGPVPRGSLQTSTATRSQADDTADGEAYKAPDGTLYFVSEDNGEFIVKDKDGNEVSRKASKDEALTDLNNFITAGDNTTAAQTTPAAPGGPAPTPTPATPDPDAGLAPSAPPVGPVMPDSEQARAEIRAGLRNATPEQLQNAVRQGGGNPDGLDGEALFSAALQVMFFLLLGVPLPRSFFTSKAVSWKISTKADNGDQRTGAMIALIPSAADIARLATEDGEDKHELHVTLDYLGKAADISENAKLKLVSAVGMVANNLSVVEGKAFSVNIFNPSGEEPCVVLGIGGEALNAVHMAIDSICRQIDLEEPGFTNPEQHKPFVPHITLKHFRDEPVDMGFVQAQFDKLGPVRFDKIRVAFAGRDIDMPLLGKYTAGDVPSDVHGDDVSEYKAPIITPGGRRGNDRTTGSRSNRENWVERSKPGKLPRYIRIVRNGLMREGHSESRATALAVAAIKRWARGGDNVTPKVQAAAVKALAEWEAMKASKAVDRAVLFLKAGSMQDVDGRSAGASHIANRIAEGTRSAVAAAQRAGAARGGGKGKRRVRSRAGELRYGKPIGSEIGEADIKRKEKADNLPDAIKKKMPMEFGQQGPHIQKIQKLLSDAGFPIETDGIFGKKTKAAIAEAQKQLGLKQTGVIDPITYVAILEASRPRRTSRSNRRRPRRPADD